MLKIRQSYIFGPLFAIRTSVWNVIDMHIYITLLPLHCARARDLLFTYNGRDTQTHIHQYVYRSIHLFTRRSE